MLGLYCNTYYVYLNESMIGIKNRYTIKKIDWHFTNTKLFISNHIQLVQQHWIYYYYYSSINMSPMTLPLLKGNNTTAINYHKRRFDFDLQICFWLKGNYVYEPVIMVKFWYYVKQTFLEIGYQM